MKKRAKKIIFGATLGLALALSIFSGFARLYGFDATGIMAKITAMILSCISGFLFVSICKDLKDLERMQCEEMQPEKERKKQPVITEAVRVVYIAGKMSGLPDLGRAAFMKAERDVAGLGFTPLNPARLPDNMPRERYMPICMAMLEQADAIYMLRGWEDSPGARVELAFAKYQNKAEIYEEDLP